MPQTLLLFCAKNKTNPTKTSENIMTLLKKVSNRNTEN